jgi:hypothetical protein
MTRMGGMIGLSLSYRGGGGVRWKKLDKVGGRLWKVGRGLVKAHKISRTRRSICKGI